MTRNEHLPPEVLRARARRRFLTESFCGFGALAVGALDRESRGLAAAEGTAARPAHAAPAPARSVIFLFMAGGPSHLETFDPKPLLTKLDGQPRPAEFGEAKYQFVAKDARLLASRRAFTKCGESGIEISDLYPHLSARVDDLAVVRSCHCDKVVHSAAQYELFSGRRIPGFPSMGSWCLYGLGSESRALPGYVVLPDPHGALEAGQPMYAQGFLPAVFQPTMLRSGPTPVRNLAPPDDVPASRRAETVRLIRDLNRDVLPEDDAELAARLESYDLAFRMQSAAPEAFDLTRETRETHALYGLDETPTDDYGRRCLLARRLVERGVRFVTVVSGGGPATQQWDAHTDIEENHARMAARTDRPIAALLTDLKRRGLLDSTLVLWGGEFGRSPENQGRGRDHHNLGFTMWMAGGGIRGGLVVGATDAIGLKAVEEPHHFRDIHATLLDRLGLVQDELSWWHQGRRERLTEIHGEPIRRILL